MFLSEKRGGRGAALLLLPVHFIASLMVAADVVASDGPGSLDEVELPAVERAPWRFTGFPILGWWAPPGTASLDDFIAYREAGFTLHPLNPDTGFWQGLEKIEKAGLQALVFRKAQGFGLDPAEVDFDDVRDREPVAGWITHDEPSGHDGVVEAIAAVNALMREDPTRWALFNFLPPQAQQNPSTAPIIDAAVQNGMPILSYDHYIIHADGTTDRQSHFDNLELVREASLRHEVPFWAFALTIQHWHYRRASESDVRWKHFTNLAYGAKGLWYFTYWGPTDWENWDHVAIVDPADGSKTDLYEHVRAINHTILEMGDLLLRLRSEAVVHTNPPAGHRPFAEESFWISNIEASDALIGFFLDPADGGRYALVVNNRHGKELAAAETAETVKLTFAPDMKGVTAVSWLDGEPGPLELRERKAALRIAGGTGVLLRADPPASE